MNLFKQYAGLRRELYIVFWGRVVTNMGALIWPMMTLILKNKLGMSASEIAAWLLVLGLLQLPATLMGGRLADRFNKRNIIIVCDLVTVVSYFVCAFVPVTKGMIWLLAIAAIFAQMEWPSYDALVADLSTSAERERAYSLNYLGANLGLVLAPILGGFLFENHLNLAFLISSLATFSSTILIFLFIKDVRPVRETGGGAQYEEGSNKSLWGILGEKKLLIAFLLCGGVAQLVYSQFNFLLPLNLEQLYGAAGAKWFGMLTSVNAAVVIVGTPLITRWFSALRDVGKIIVGEALIAAGFAMYIFIQGVLPLYFLSMVIFTVGEVFTTLGKQPYATRRIPASHRGRFASLNTVLGGGLQLGGQQCVGHLADAWPMRSVWCLIAGLGFANVLAYLAVRRRDEKTFPLLYEKQPEQTRL